MLKTLKVSEKSCVAPAEGEKPLNIMTDSNFEAMSNPDKFPYGVGTYSSERPRKLTYRKYWLLDVDGRFSRDLDYLFVAQYIVEAKQVSDDGNNFVWRQKPSRQFTAAQARDQTVLSQYIRIREKHSWLPAVLPAYFLSMIRQLGTPTWFFTLSAADLKWPDTIPNSMVWTTLMMRLLNCNLMRSPIGLSETQLLQPGIYLPCFSKIF